MAVQVAALPVAKWILTTAIGGLLGNRRGIPLARNPLFGDPFRAIARAANAASPLPPAQAATVTGPKVSSTRRPPPGQEPLLNPPTEYRPPPQGPDWNPPPLYPGGTPGINPVGGGPPNLGILLDPQAWINSAWWTNEYLASVFATATRAPQRDPRVGPRTRPPKVLAGQGDPWGSPEARAAERAAERAERAAERAEERAEERRERERRRQEDRDEAEDRKRRIEEANEGLDVIIVPTARMDETPTKWPSPPKAATPPKFNYLQLAGLAIPLLSSLTGAGSGRSRRRDPLTQPQPDGNPFPGDYLTSSYSPGVAYGSAFGPPAGTVGTNTCECKAPRKKRRKKKRTVCYSGTYRERADGTRKTKKRKVPCQA